MASSQTNYYYPHFAPPPTPTIRPPPPPSHFIPPPPSHFIPPPPPHALPPQPPHALPPPPPHAIAPPPPHVFPPPPPHVIPPPPPNALPPPPPPGGHTTVIVVVFVSLGSVFFLAFLAIALCCFMKKRKKKSVQETENLHIDEHRKVKEEVVQGPHGTQATVVTIEDDIHIDEEIRKNEMMGKGTTHLKSGDNDAAAVAGMLESGEASSSSGPSGHGRHLL